MSELTELIDSLEVKFSKMYHKLDTLEKKIKNYLMNYYNSKKTTKNS